MTKFLPAVLMTALVALTPLAASASTMPKADFGSRPTLGLGLGYGAGASIDLPLSSALSIGGSVGWGYFSAAGIDLRGLYKLANVPLSDRNLQIDLLVGGDAYGLGGAGMGFSPFAGVALALPLTDRLLVRGNVAVSFLNYGRADADGAELAYRFSPNMEGTIGWNGRGDVLGLKLAF